MFLMMERRGKIVIVQRLTVLKHKQRKITSQTDTDIRIWMPIKFLRLADVDSVCLLVLYVVCGCFKAFEE